MSAILFYILSSLVNALVATILGFIVYFRNRKELVNRVFALFCAVVAIWSYAYFVLFFVKNASIGVFYHRLFLTVPAIFIAILFFNFVLAFISKIKENKSKLIAGYIISFVFVFIDLFTPFFVKNLEQKLYLGLWPTAGPLYFPFLLIWWFYVIFAIYFLCREIYILPNDKNSEKMKIQLKYILAGAVIGFGGGGIINYLLWYNIPIPPITNFLVAVGMIAIAYGIVKHHMFNIKLLMSELLVFTIWIFVIARTALSNNIQDLLINGTLILLVFVAGILLMRSASKEVEVERKLLKETQKDLDLEQRLRKTFAEIAEEQTKKIEKIVSDKKFKE